MNRFEEYCDRKRAEYGEKFSDASLAPQFIAAFNAGDTVRIAVPNRSDSPRPRTWGFVGVTTGWKPAFLLMRKRGQHGSSYILDNDTPILATKRR
jgi:hypothetical protein